MYAPQGGSRFARAGRGPRREIRLIKHTQTVIEGVARAQKFVLDSERKLLGEGMLLIDRPSMVLRAIP